MFDHSALTELIYSFSPRQLKGARAWIESPVFNKRQAPLLLFDYLAECRSKQQTPELNTALGRVFEEGAKDLARLRHEMSELSDLLRDFLVWEELEKTPSQREWLRLRVMRKKGLEKNFQLAAHQAEKALQSNTTQKSDQHLFSFRVQAEYYAWAEARKRDHELSLAALQKDLDAWYAGQLLQLACMNQSRQNMRRAPGLGMLQAETLDQLLNQLPTQPQHHQPDVNIYYLGYKMLAEPENGAIMEAYRELLSAYIVDTHREEASDLLMLAINHGIRRINAGDKDAIRRTLGFYLMGLEKKLFHDDQGRLSKYTYNNVLMTFLALEEWTEAAAFLEQYRGELPVKERENIFQYNLSIYHFRKGDYHAALELLRSVALLDPMYKLESRKMLLKIYYEQGATDALESLLENLLLWLRRHGEIGYHREMYRNLARFTGQLLRLPPSEPQARKRLEKKIMETPLVAERDWLLGKVRSGRLG